MPGTGSQTHAQTQVQRLQIAECDVGLRSSGTAGPDVVLIHGIGASARYFERLARELSVDNRVHCVELPGHGGLPRPPRALSMAAYGGVVIQALQAAGISRAQLVGHSMGCQVTVEAALQAPDLVSSVLLLAPTVNRAEHAAVLQALRLAQDTLHESLDVNRIVFTDYLRAGPRWYLETLRQMMEHRLEERLALVAPPVGVVRGAKDPIVPASWLARLEQARPGTLLGEIPESPHVLMWNRPVETAAWVRRMGEAGA
ncbi:alpha/beta hydrolase [Arthrobacter sp. Helios]|uniref:alpha/beta fold hydrolase n=1 Tax=Arthrobacter sp. Helios TaxID=2828862 RepID=UPI002061A68F|nr:alpha/beta hydrolase [Arthrobacter sp. Helios]UPO75903.1 alpha/beta hydrolase [Arthrobacter sp. Helios]